jgi:Flp pilus assembly protein TadG
MNGLAKHERGTAIVEFTIALPLLMVLLLATAELGRMLSQYNTLTKSVRDSARYLASKASGGTTRVVSISNQVRTETQNLAVTGNINGTGGPLLPGYAIANVTVANAGNGYVSVAASYTYVPMISAALPMFGLGSDVALATSLSSTVVMRAL